jgi:hypothetical protein
MSPQEIRISSLPASSEVRPVFGDSAALQPIRWLDAAVRPNRYVDFELAGKIRVAVPLRDRESLLHLIYALG